MSSALLWIRIVVEIIGVLSRMSVLGARLASGKEVSAEELAAARQRTVDVVARWDAAEKGQPVEPAEDPNAPE